MIDALHPLVAYLRQTDEFAVYPGAGEGTMGELAYLALGLAGETGEAVDVIKKALRNGGNLSHGMAATLESELGDVLWYWARLVDAAGLSVLDVMEANIVKLRERQAAGTLKARP